MSKSYKYFLFLSAFFIPIYFIFYPPLNERYESNLVKSLWISIFMGFLFYAVMISVIVFT